MNSVPLHSVCNLKGGSGFPERFQGQSSGDYPFIKVSDMNLPGNHREIVESTHYVDKSIVDLLRLSVFPKGTVVFAKVGAALLLNRRRLLTQDTIIDNNMMGAVAFNIDSKFLCQFLQTVDFGYFVQPGVVPSVNQNILGAIQTPSPPLPEQRKIASILTTVDNLIEHTEALIEKYKSIKQGMMHDLFTRGVDQSGRLRPPYEDAPHLYKQSPLGWIPKEWEVDTLGSLTDKIADRDHFTPFYVTDGVPIVSPKDFGRFDRISFVGCRFITDVAHEKNRRKTDIGAGDVVFTRIGAALGKACLVTPDMPEFSLLHSAVMIRPSKNLFTSSFLLYTLRSYYLQHQIGAQIQSIGVPDLGLDKINAFRVKIPSVTEQQQIAVRFDSLESAILSEDRRRNEMQLIKTGLMQDLLTGKVRVKVDEAEEVTADV